MRRAVSVFGVLALAASSALAQQYSNDFAFGDPQGAQLFGDATITGGALRLTREVNGLSGAIVLPISGQNVRSFTASFNLRYNNTAGVPADGVSFNLGVLPDGVIPGASENGPGNGLTVMVDNFDFNGDGFVGDEGLRVFQNGTQIAGVALGLSSSIPNTLVEITLDLDGTIDVRFGGNLVVNNLATGFVPQNRQRFGLAARTGAEAAEQFVDDLVGDAAIPAAALHRSAGHSRRRAVWLLRRPGHDHHIRGFVRVDDPADLVLLAGAGYRLCARVHDRPRDA